MHGVGAPLDIAADLEIERHPAVRHQIGKHGRADADVDLHTHDLAHEGARGYPSRQAAFDAGPIQSYVLRPNAQCQVRSPGQRRRRRNADRPARHGDLALPVRARRKPVADADEIRHEGVHRLEIDFHRRADLDDLAAFHDRDAVRHGERLFLIMGYEHGRRACAADNAADLGAQRDANLGVERRQWLIEQQYRRIGRQGARERHSLLLAAGELMWVALRQLADARQRAQLVDACIDRRFRPPAQAQRKANIAAHRHGRKQRVGLEYEADVAFARRQRLDPPAVDQELASVGTREAGDDPEQGRLAAAGTADESDEFTGGDLERDIVDRANVAEALADVPQAEAGHGASSNSGGAGTSMSSSGPRPPLDGEGGQRVRSEVVAATFRISMPRRA